MTGADMGYNIGWIIPRLRNPGRLWYCASTFTLAVVGLFSKIVIVWLNKTTVYNREVLARAVWRPQGTPLLTVSNHHSCFDDPGLWGLVDVRTLCGGARMRWSLAAHDICFTNALHSYFFSLGRCVPVVRGAGVHQPAIDFCIERLRRGDWVHIFPEGRVNVDKEFIRLKWGVGRMVAECASPPLVLPIWHEGMDSVLPNREPYLLRARQRVFLNVGQPIHLHHILDRLRKEKASEEETRRAITDRIQEELLRLRDQTHLLMRQTLGAAADCLLRDRTDILVGPRQEKVHDPHTATDSDRNLHTATDSDQDLHTATDSDQDLHTATDSDQDLHTATDSDQDLHTATDSDQDPHTASEQTVHTANNHERPIANGHAPTANHAHTRPDRDKDAV